MKFEIIDSQTNEIKVSVGKKYLYYIVDCFIKGKEKREEVHKEVDCFINHIGDYKDVLYRFQLDETVLQGLKELEQNGFLANNPDGKVDFGYWNILSYMLLVYSYFLEDVRGRKVHLWFELSPKEADDHRALGDVLPDYNSIMCKSSLKTYIQYTDRAKSSDECWVYQISLLYLIIINKLFEILQSYIDDIPTFIQTCFEALNPIITGFTATVEYDLGFDGALCVVHQLRQLHPGSQFLDVDKGSNASSVTFIYHLYNNNFHNSMKEPERCSYRYDKNGDRLVKLQVTGHKNILSMRVELFGLNPIKDLTDMAVRKDLYTFVTDNNCFDAIVYKVFSTVLSHTKEHKDLYEETKKIAHRNHYKGLYLNCWGEPELSFKKNIVKSYAEGYLFDRIFLDIKPYNLEIIIELLCQEFNLSDRSTAYILYAISFAPLSNKEVSAQIKHLGPKQQSKIRKMVDFVRAVVDYVDKPGFNCLHYIYKKVSDKCC